jgi:hypothetical protein
MIPFIRVLDKIKWLVSVEKFTNRQQCSVTNAVGFVLVVNERTGKPSVHLLELNSLPQMNST